MSRYARYAVPIALMTASIGGIVAAQGNSYPFTWATVINTGDYMPTDLCDPTAPNPAQPPCRTFNSFNAPSVNRAGLVVVRARSRGGQGLGEPVQGVYVRDMAVGAGIIRLFDRTTAVPPPNNRGTLFGEPPSFPRIDIGSATVSSRGNHQPVWAVSTQTGDNVEQLGTSGIYTNPFGDLITGAAKLGTVPEFSFFEVPERPGTPFDVFPGAPAITAGNILVFKGNYTADAVGKTGVYFRELLNSPILDPDGTPLIPAGGTMPVVLIANNTDTFIPGTATVFGSVAPPSAANLTAVFAGFDNEENPALGGIYLASLTGPQPSLTTLVSLGAQVPGESGKARFNRLGESVSFDGRFVAFWGAWGADTKTLVLPCPTEGNADRIAFCNEQYPSGFTTRVPVHQGVFVHDTRTRQTRAVAKTPDDFDDFIYWSFTGHAPGMDGGHAGDGDDDGEPARWRFSSFVAVSGMVDGSFRDASFDVAFKARTGRIAGGTYRDPVDGVYLRKGPGQPWIVTVAESGLPGTRLDPEAVDASTGNALPVTGVVIERDGFRGKRLVIAASMGSGEVGWAGVYLTEVSK